MPPRRSLAAIVAATAVLTVAACADDVSSLPDRPGPRVAVTLDATFARTPTSLTWTYTLRNDEPGEVAAFTGSSADAAGGVSNSTGAWVVPRDEETVEVSQRLFAQPPKVGLARPYTQFGTVIPAGAVLSGSASVQLPLKVSHPYGSAFKPPLELPSDPKKVVFCVGVARAKDIPPSPSETPPSLYASPDGPAPEGARKARYVHAGGGRQYLVCAPPEELG
ncbi:hypothetical protein AB0368_34385 [Actinoplanes sp. NPDC051475]|uniref:hypothetical protein n=1 Tax=Actinoplanes sp. NPDC051475 TaxID=3157225 RepID=UPI00344CE3BF